MKTMVHNAGITSLKDRDPPSSRTPCRHGWLNTSTRTPDKGSLPPPPPPGGRRVSRSTSTPVSRNPNPHARPDIGLGPCETHPSCQREFDCHTDHSIICIKCVFIDHNNHEVKTLKENVENVLHSKLDVLQEGQDYLQHHLQQKQSSTKFFRGTLDVMKEAVISKLSGQTFKTEPPWQSLMEQLDEAYSRRVSEQETYSKYVKEKLKTLQCLHKEIKKALNCWTAKGSLSGQVLKQAADADLKQWLKQLQASLHIKTSDIFLFTEDPAQGDDRSPDLTVSRLTGRIDQKFTCSDDPGVLVQSMCFSSGGYVVVAYMKQAWDAVQDGWVAKFTPKGKSDWEPQTTRGRVCLAALQDNVVRVEGEGFPPMNFHSQFVDAPDTTSSDSKRYDVFSKLAAPFLIRACKSEQCEVRSVAVDGLTTTDELLFNIQAADPVAMDASEDGLLFAVLEKDQPNVKLFRYDGNVSPDSQQQTEPCAIYTGNGQPILPRDVCFFAIGGQERLVVADWLNDLLHVLDVTEGCNMIGQVGGDCMELRQPTALCPDSQGRLWVGCQGGHVLTLTYP
ncbi:hypothetical protein ACOMHN_001407 [Nucella lapillus]